MKMISLNPLMTYCYLPYIDTERVQIVVIATTQGAGHHHMLSVLQVTPHLLWRHHPLFYDVTNSFFMTSLSPFFMTSLPPLLCCYNPCFYYDIATYFYSVTIDHFLPWHHSPPFYHFKQLGYTPRCHEHTPPIPMTHNVHISHSYGFHISLIRFPYLTHTVSI